MKPLLCIVGIALVLGALIPVALGWLPIININVALHVSDPNVVLDTPLYVKSNTLDVSIAPNYAEKVVRAAGLK